MKTNRCWIEYSSFGHYEICFLHEESNTLIKTPSEDWKKLETFDKKNNLLLKEFFGLEEADKMFRVRRAAEDFYEVQSMNLKDRSLSVEKHYDMETYFTYEKTLNDILQEIYQDEIEKMKDDLKKIW